MVRHLRLLTFALFRLRTRAWRHLAISMVYAFLVFFASSVVFYSDAMEDEAARLLSGGPDLVVQSMKGGRSVTVKGNHAGRIEGILGVSGVAPRYWGYYFDPLSRANFTIMALSGPAPEIESMEGGLPQGPGECAIGAGVAAARSLGVGDDLVLLDSEGTGRVFLVTGVFTAASSLLTNDLVLLHMTDVKDILALDGPTDLAVTVANPMEVDTVASKIREISPLLRPLAKRDILATYQGVFKWRGGVMLLFLFMPLLAFAILVWDRATGVSGEDLRLIGILKALGWTSSDVMEVKFLESLAVSLSSFGLGFLAGLAHVYLWGAPLISQVIRGWSKLFPAFVPGSPPHLEGCFSLALIFVAPYLVAGVLPFWKSASMDPDVIMRG